MTRGEAGRGGRREREGRNDQGDPPIHRACSLFVVVYAAEEVEEYFFGGSYFLIVF